MRIIAGKYRSRKLVTLEGLKTRPTLDQTKEAIFSSIGYRIVDAITLDVFGGSGALSLESLSRGAKYSYIIDDNIDAIKIIKQNVSSLNANNDIRIYHNDYHKVLPSFIGRIKFDVVFLDPPFRLKVIDELIAYLIDNDLLNDNAIIMAEYPNGDIVNKNYPGYKVKLCRRYASSEVLLLEKE